MKYLLLLALITSCATLPPIEEKPVVVETPVTTSKYIADWDGAWILPKGSKVKEKVPDTQYTEFLVNALKQSGQKLLAMPSIKDSSLYCPKFSSLNQDEKMQFFVMLISAMARHESGFDYRTSYYEKNVEGNPTSRGLLQISIPSVNSPRYGCKITDSKQLHDPKTNLDCAVKVISSLVVENGYLGKELGANEKSDYRGASRYFSVLRKWLKKNGVWIIRPARVDIVNRLKKVKACW